jgi:hypothetical protein
MEYLVEETLIEPHRLLYPKGRTFFAVCGKHVFRNFFFLKKLGKEAAGFIKGELYYRKFTKTMPFLCCCITLLRKY